jgi:hypothetical protein
MLFYVRLQFSLEARFNHTISNLRPEDVIHSPAPQHNGDDMFSTMRRVEIFTCRSEKSTGRRFVRMTHKIAASSFRLSEGEVANCITDLRCTDGRMCKRLLLRGQYTDQQALNNNLQPSIAVQTRSGHKMFLCVFGQIVINFLVLHSAVTLFTAVSFVLMISATHLDTTSMH